MSLILTLAVLFHPGVCYVAAICDSHYASINAKPEWGGGPWAYVGHLTSIAFPTLRNLTRNLGPRVGTFAFFAQRNETKSNRSICSSVCQPSWN